MTNLHHRHASGEPVRAYSFDLRDIVAVIPREMLSGVLPASPRLTLQLPPESLDSTRNYLTTSLGTIWRACPVLFAQPVSPASDRMVVLVRPNEGVVSPFRIASPLRPGSGQVRQGAVAGVVARAATAPVQAAAAHPFLQQTTHFGQPMQTAMPVHPAHSFPGQEGPAEAPVRKDAQGGDPAGSLAPQQEIPDWKRKPEPKPEEPAVVPAEGSSPFLSALRQGLVPAERAPAEVAMQPAEAVTFSLVELFGNYSPDMLPFDPVAVVPDWKIRFPVEFITRQLPSGRVAATLAMILECVEEGARAALAGFAGNEVEVAIPLREVFERLPVTPKRPVMEPESLEIAPDIFSEKGEAPSGGKLAEDVFPGRFEPKQTVLEPIVPPGEDLADVPEYSGLDASREPEEVGLLDELEAPEACAVRDRAPVGLVDSPGGRPEAVADDEDGLKARHVPDFSGLGFAGGPMADLELRAMFATQEVFTPQKAVERTAELPGVDGAVLFSRRGELVAAVLPADEAAKRLGQQTPAIFSRIQELAGDLGFAGSEVFTLHTGSRIVSFFGHGGCCLAILHGERIFGPGMREKLMLIARGAAALLREQEAE